ncbi:MAG: acyl--CoA ligase [Deltaproteobacteria bacterium]|nr:acyl--CoA ligase [Deltaproteobacteria bacterium]
MSRLHEWVLRHAERTPGAPAVHTLAVRLDYQGLAARLRALAGHLAASGVGPGDRVLVALPNTPATVVASLAIQALGATPVEVNREWSPEILADIAARTGVRQAFGWGRDARAWGRIRALRPIDRLWMVHGGPLPAPLVADAGPGPVHLLLDDGSSDPALGPAPVTPLGGAGSAPALILYTSGSTGQPRGVVQTHANVAANTRSIVEYLGLGPQDRALLVLPLYYCYGRSVLQTHLFAGGSVFLEGRLAFPRVVMQAIAAEGCTGFAGVPLTFELIRRQVDVAAMKFPRLRYLTQAGGAMAPETISWVRGAFHPARLFVMYGQTEATARLSYLPPERAEEKKGSIGIPIPGVHLAVVDEAGRELPIGETGHLVARGDNVTPGYLDEPEETSAILHDGWLWTGDLAFRDPDGFFFHQGRSKEILKVGGHRVSPVEIEHVVAEHPEVAEAAVIGAPDQLMGELPVAFVVPRPGCAPTPEAIQRFCRERMAAWRVPARVHFLPSLPRNEAGKLLRAQLRAQEKAPA